MNRSKIKQILFLTRPWQVEFHLDLAKELEPEFGDIPIRFITFFWWAKEKVEEAGYECIYMPVELEKVTGFEMSDSEFTEIDNLLFEKQGANFNLMLHSERYLPKCGKTAEVFGRKHLVVISRIVVQGTLSISSMYDHFVYWLCGALVNSRGGAHFAFVSCGFPPGRVLALRTPWKTWSVPFKENASALLEECKRLLYTPANERIEYMRPQKIPPLRKRWLNRLHEVLCNERDRIAGSYFAEAGAFSLAGVKNRLPTNWFKCAEPIYDITDYDALNALEGTTCYLPLHMEPEATILMFSPWLRDQIEMCRLICQALPVGWKLLVKDNPKMRGIRPVDYYDKLRLIPNLLLVSPILESTNLMLAARVVVTLAGTASNEAAILGKNSIALGRPPGRSMLASEDLGLNLKLAEMFNLLQRSPIAIDDKIWGDWLCGSFRGNNVPIYTENGTYSTPRDSGNVSAFSKYIMEALKNE